MDFDLTTSASIFPCFQINWYLSGNESSAAPPLFRQPDNDSACVATPVQDHLCEQCVRCRLHVDSITPLTVMPVTCVFAWKTWVIHC